ncbi:LCP family protein [Oceanirhabdus sp. W0125-5]|uniref:LCP family protein n=1 Tax=Oceanirhabdus sp. W0125-5 TaxID=2999116 RepID=UPI0022F2B18B|nr:LCP family protein [Oceanirhabdus sp. W0125-5]WBW98942.1 LCP family protein [Oceanirhabdus sp. W0125-5]
MNKQKKNCVCIVISMLIIVLLISNKVYARPIVSDYVWESELDFMKQIELMDKLEQKRIENKKLKDMKIRSEKGIVNILLVGVDNRESRKNGRSDAMMILTLDQKKNNMKITSLMRDTYVYIKGHGKEKLNHSYAYGGIKLLRNTVENTFKVKIDNYIIVDYQDFENIVDILGGVEVYLDEQEIPFVNRVANEKIEQVGLHKLNGKEALIYARIRKVGNGSYERTERQREVISNLQKGMKNLSFMKYPKLLGRIIKSVNTDMKLTNILDYGYWYYRNSSMEMDKLQIPTTELSEGILMNKEKGWVIKMNTIENIKTLSKFIFGDIEL